MGLALAARLVDTADRQDIGGAAVCLGMNGAQFRLDAGHADAGDARVHAGEELGHQGARQADRLEIAPPPIGRDHRNPHLRHDFQQALVDGVAEVGDGLLGAGLAEQPARRPVQDRLLRQPGVDRGRADPDQHREVMRVQALGRAHVERAEGAQAARHQPAVGGRGRQDHRHGDIVRIRGLVGQDDVAGAGADRFLRLPAHPVEGLTQGAGAAVGREHTIDHPVAVAEGLGQALELAVRDHRAFQGDDLGLARALVEHVLQVAEAGLQAHHPVLAQAVDGRVGDLAEVLPEEVAQRPVEVREHRRRGVVAHRADGLLGVLGHRVEDGLQLLDRIAGGDLAAAQLGAPVEPGLGLTLDLVRDLDDLLDPFRIRLGGGQLVLELGVVQQPASRQVDGQHLARAEATLLADRALVGRHHADLGAGNHQPVAGDDVAHGAQPVAVHPDANPAPVGHGQRGGAVPRLHHRVGIGIHRPPGFRHRLAVRPRLRHQHGLGHRRAAPGPHHDLEHRVQRGAVGRAVGDDRLDVLGQLAKEARRHADLVAPHPVHVALQGVDLAVVGQHPERLRQPPLREGVGGIALVVDGEGRDETRLLEVGVELGHLLGQHHALVDQRATRQRADVEARDLRLRHRLLDAPPDHVEFALEGLLVDPLGVRDQDLLDGGPGDVGLLAQHGDVHRHLAPAVDVVAEPQHLGLDDGAAGLLGIEIGPRQEHLADRQQRVLGLVAGAPDLIPEEVHGDLQMDARTIAGLAVGVDGAPVPDRLQGGAGVLDHVAPGPAVDGGDQADAAGGVLGVGQIHAVAGEAVAFRLVGVNPALVDDAACHGINPRVGRLWRRPRRFRPPLPVGFAGDRGRGCGRVSPGEGVGGEARGASRAFRRRRPDGRLSGPTPPPSTSARDGPISRAESDLRGEPARCRQTPSARGATSPAAGAARSWSARSRSAATRRSRCRP